MAARKKTSKVRAPAPFEKHSHAILCGLLAIAAILVFWNLGQPCLWDDEAQTAVVAQNILANGVPAASNGHNFVSIFPDHRDIRDGIYIWQGWLPTYLAAGSMAVLGQNAFAARFPFAVAFVVFIGFFYVFLRRWLGDHGRHLWVTLALTVTCVPLLLHARQCRYYALVPLINLLIIDAYLSYLKEPKRKHQIWLMVWATALVNSFFPGAVLLGIALLIDLIRRRPAKIFWMGFAVAAAAVLIVNLPMAWYCRIWDRRFGVQSGYDNPAVFGMYLLRYLLTLNNYFFPLSLIVAACALRWKAITRRAVFSDNVSFLFLVVCVTQLLGFAVLSDYPFTRYIIGILPCLMFFGAICLEAVAFGRPWVVWLFAIVVAATNLFQILPLPLLRKMPLQSARWTTAGINPEFLEAGNVGYSFARGEIKQLINLPLGYPLLDFVRVVIHPPRGPIDWIAEYLKTNAKPNDRVKISSGDLPLMFHSSLKVVSATEVGPPGPEWMLFRRFGPMKMDETFVRETSKSRYSKITIPFPDLQWNNQPDPLYHYYQTPSPDLAPPISILRKD